MRRRISGVVAGVALIASFAARAEVRSLCTTTIVGDVAAHVAGTDLAVDALLPPGADPHTFEATPSDLARIAHADVIFENGAGLEEFLLPLLAAADARVVDLSAGLALRTVSADTVHAEGRNDPHVWFDPAHVIAWVDVAAAVLVRLDPEHAAAYEARAAAYQESLRELDAWIVEQVSRIPTANRRLVTDHDALGYFTDRHGFQLVGTAIPGSSALSEPSAREIAALEDCVLGTGGSAVFVGTTVNPALAAQVAADTGAQLVLLYTGSLSDPQGPALTYIDLVRYDVAQIVSALAESP